jgi:tetratricopeptide (TPR) repeat protein
MTMLPRLALRLAAMAALLLIWLGPRPTAIAYAADPTQADTVQWVAINVLPTGAPGPNAAIHIEADVKYAFRSASSGFLTLFVFENHTQTSSLHSPQIQTVGTGGGSVKLDMLYQPHPGVQSVTFFAGLFQDNQSLLAWAATDAVALNDWEAKVAFVSALQNQQINKYAQAVADLTAAIQMAPQVGNFYYWRADDRSHLGQYAAAIADYDQALRLMPQDRPSLLGRGIAQLWNGAPSTALSDLSAVINSGGTADQLTAWAYRAAGIAQADLGQNSAAVSDYQSYLQLTPDASDYSQVQGWIDRLNNQASS